MGRIKIWIGALACALVTVSAHAELNPLDSAFGAGTLILDTNTGLQWLQPGVTAGMTYASVGASLDAGETFAGFHIATYGELVGLFSSTGLPELYEAREPTPSEVLAGQNFVALFGGTVGDGYGSVRAFYDHGDGDPFNAWGHHAGLYYSSLPGGTSEWYTDGILASRLGTWLVATPVPEPSTYALMLAGLGVLALAARRRQRQ